MEGTIREVTVEYIEALMPLLYQLSPLKEGEKELSLEEMKKHLQSMIDDPNRTIVVMEMDGKLVGTADLSIQPVMFHGCRGCGHIENVVVDKDHRKKGIAYKLVDHLLALAKEKNCYKAILDCVPEIIKVYEKSGFTTTGEVQMRVSF